MERALLLSNNIGEEGAKAIEEMLRHNSSLNYLSLQDNLLPPSSMEAVKEAAARRGDLVVKI